METTFKTFMQGMIDYAGLFPPADLSLDTAIQNYSDYRKSEDAWMLSRFIIPSSRLDELKPYGDTLFREGEPFAFSVLGKGTETVSEFEEHLRKLIDDVETFHQTHGDRVTTKVLEIKLPREAVFANDTDLLIDLYDETAQALDGSGLTPNYLFFEGYFEENWKKDIRLVLEAMRSHNKNFDGDNIRETAFKLRCGGVKAHMFPSVEEIAFALNTARENNVALKATAGLHHPIRHYADSVQTRMHGFFNIFGGGMLAYAHDLDEDKLIEVLKEEDPEQFSFSKKGFRWKNFSVSGDEIKWLRKTALISFGSCSFDEPREDLQQLGYI